MITSTNMRRLAVAVYAAFLCFAAAVHVQKPAGMSTRPPSSLVPDSPGATSASAPPRCSASSSWAPASSSEATAAVRCA